MYMLILQKFTSQYKTQFMSQANLTCIIQPDGVVSISDKQLNMSVQQQDTEETRVFVLESMLGNILSCFEICLFLSDFNQFSEIFWIADRD